MIGHTLGGRYELLTRVGGGGMALVYQAKDLLLGRYVAVKVLRQQFMHDEDFVRRFRREAQAAASLSHPNIVSIYDVGQDDDAHYIVMEYVDGPNLNEIIRERAPLQTDEAVRITSQICDALDHAHQNQIIHRDIKPHNILIGKNGRVKVTDFGIARAVTSSTITQTGSVVGSVHYFSPEHAKGVATGEKSDLYSLGIVMYQMLTGRLPFLGESPISVALKHLQEPFEPPREVNPYIPQSVENIILRAMRKNPQERYQSAQEMLADLETCLNPERLNEPPIRFRADADETERTRVMPAIRPDMRTSAPEAEDEEDGAEEAEDEAEEPTRRRWVLPTVFGAIGLILVAALIWAVLALKGQLTPADVQVPTVVGHKLDEARQMLEEAGLKVADPVLEASSDKYGEGIVISQSKQDIKVKEGSLIQLTVSTGPELPNMPDVTGKTYDDAVSQLTALGLAEGSIHKQEAFSDEVAAGVVMQQSLEPNQPFDPAAQEVTLTVSKGRETFAMPSLIGMTLDKAKETIAQYHLKLPDDKIIYEQSFSPADKVFKQFPAEQNESVTAGTEVTIWISSGYPKDTVQKSPEVTVAPAEVGKTSTVRIVYSDASGDNIEWKTVKIKSMTTFQVPVFVTPDKDAQIMVYRDGQLVDILQVPYKDEQASPSSGQPGVGEGGGDGGQPPGGDAGAGGGDAGGAGGGNAQ